ncbi:hypothetical protein JCM8547_006710 [Rhodosporidiobolus lusitaniae]
MAVQYPSPPTSPTYTATAYPSSHQHHQHHRGRSRFRPSLPVLVLLLSHAFLFLYYQRRDSSLSSSSSSSSPSCLSSSSSPSSSASQQSPSLASSTFSPLDPVSPTQSCELCHLDPSNPLCEYGEDNIRLSRAYEGSGYRLRRALQKALRGEEVGVGVIGASITQGHGLPDHINQVWHHRFFEDFNKLFPKAKLHVAAVGAMDSHFFAYCFPSLLPSDLDIYVLELDINNHAALDQLRDDDTLMRALLQLPQEPAVLRVSAFAVLFDELAQGIVSSLTTSAFFDIPVIGVRNFLLPHVIHHRDVAEELFGMDPWNNRDYRHMSQHAHQALGDMLALFMRKEVCETKRRASLPPPPKLPQTGPWPTGEDLGKIPPLAIWSSWLHPKPLTPVHPMCQTAVSPFSPMKPYSHSSTFKLLEWNGKAAWSSSRPGSQIRFRFEGTRVGVFVWASNGGNKEEQAEDVKVRRENAPGSALCWVEEFGLSEEEWERRLEAMDEGEGEEAEPLQSRMVNSHQPQRAAAGPDFIEIAEDLHYGEHILACEVQSQTSSGGFKWRVMGVASQ